MEYTNINYSVAYFFTRACSDRARDDSFKLTEGRIRLEIRKNFFPVRGVMHWQIAQRSCGCPASGEESIFCCCSSGSSPFLQKQYSYAEEMPSQLLTIIKSYEFFYFIFPNSHLEMLGLEGMLLPTYVTL